MELTNTRVICVFQFGPSSKATFMKEEQLNQLSLEISLRLDDEQTEELERESDLEAVEIVDETLNEEENEEHHNASLLLSTSRTNLKVCNERYDQLEKTHRQALL
jgi:hypothetical protein